MTPDNIYEPIPEGGEFEAVSSVVVISEPNGAAAESIRALRSQFVATHTQSLSGGLAVCGPHPETGATFVAVNLAVSLSQVGLRTLLLDADMRNPGVDRLILGPENSLGLQQCLAGEIDPQDGIQHEVLPNLSIMYAGGAAPNPQELLSGGRFRELAELWFREYDVAIVDTPPASHCSDGPYIASVLGSALAVARKDHTAVKDLRTLLVELEQVGAKVLGTVFNQH